ncbi:ABC transporter substrate-binding protein [Microlunatus speluncae]|uniref:ABC transporter substrate-binding protein n=1 Tax=Microlunatus speluncae TaxID=2594267 RepID=UPI00126665D6|nr:ABC transporter substrate-binding protein [Microlunatus speluncae]
MRAAAGVLAMIMIMLSGCAPGDPTVPPAGRQVTDRGVWALDESTALQLLSIGVTPTHAARNPYTGDLLVDAAYQILGQTGVPLVEPGRIELVAEAAPELIIGTSFPGHVELLPQLEQIAPVQLIDDNAAWADQLGTLAAVTGHEEQAAALIGRLRADIGSLAARLEATPHAGAVVSVLSACGQQVCAYGNVRAFGGLLTELGLRRPPPQQDRGNEWGYREVSYELVSEHRGEVNLSLVGSVNRGGRPLLGHPMFDTSGLVGAEVDFNAWYGAGPLNVSWMLADLEAVLLEDGPTMTVEDGVRLWQRMLSRRSGG